MESEVIPSGNPGFLVAIFFPSGFAVDNCFPVAIIRGMRKEFADYLKHAIDSRGWSLARAASEIGCSPAFLSYILRGKRCVSLGFAVKAGNALGFAVEIKPKKKVKKQA
jgi:hypothetical protein